VPIGEGFPVVLADAQGVEVRIDRRPERIVSTAPNVTEILFALGVGGRVVAVTDQCKYPAEAARLPRIGGFWTPSAEKAMGARPDLVIGSRGNPSEFLSALRASGCPVFTIDPKTLGDIFEAIQQVAQIIGEPRERDSLISSMQGRLDTIASRLADVPEARRPSAFILLEVSSLYTAGSGTFLDEAIRAAGGRNIAGHLKEYRPFSMETLVATNPDFLLLSAMEGDPERMARELRANPALRRLGAARGGGIILLDADVISRPGPRVVEAVEAMAQAFYPEFFTQPEGPSSAATSSR
jgi:iron complex transport system substrate-binding protein